MLTTIILTGCDAGVKVGGQSDSLNSLNDDSAISHDLSFCNQTNGTIAICPATDMAKIAKDGLIVFEHKDYDFSDGSLNLSAARNETIAFQLILHKTSEQSVSNVRLNTSAITARSTNQIIQLSQSAFNAFYHPIDNAGYTWGPPTPVLPWPAEYPDALIPFEDSCSNNTNLSGTSLSDLPLAVPELINTNQSVWIDTYVPKDIQPGTYEQTLTLSIDTEHHRAARYTDCSRCTHS